MSWYIYQVQYDLVRWQKVKNKDTIVFVKSWNWKRSNTYLKRKRDEQTFRVVSFRGILVTRPCITPRKLQSSNFRRPSLDISFKESWTKHTSSAQLKPALLWSKKFVFRENHSLQPQFFRFHGAPGTVVRRTDIRYTANVKMESFLLSTATATEWLSLNITRVSDSHWRRACAVIRKMGSENLLERL